MLVWQSAFCVVTYGVYYEHVLAGAQLKYNCTKLRVLGKMSKRKSHITPAQQTLSVVICCDSSGGGIIALMSDVFVCSTCCCREL